MVGAMRGKSSLVTNTYGMEESRKLSLHQNGSTQVNGQDRTSSVAGDEVENMIKEYEKFHNRWIQRIRAMNNNCANVYEPEKL